MLMVVAQTEDCVVSHFGYYGLSINMQTPWSDDRQHERTEALANFVMLHSMPKTNATPYALRSCVQIR